MAGFQAYNSWIPPHPRPHLAWVRKSWKVVSVSCEAKAVSVSSKRKNASHLLSASLGAQVPRLLDAVATHTLGRAESELHFSKPLLWVRPGRWWGCSFRGPQLGWPPPGVACGLRE